MSEATNAPNRFLSSELSEEEIAEIVEGIEQKYITDWVKRDRYLKKKVFRGYRPSNLPWEKVPTKLAKCAVTRPPYIGHLLNLWLQSNRRFVDEVAKLEHDNLRQGVIGLLVQHGFENRKRILWALRLGGRSEVLKVLEQGLDQELSEASSDLLHEVEKAGLVARLQAYEKELHEVKRERDQAREKVEASRPQVQGKTINQARRERDQARDERGQARDERDQARDERDQARDELKKAEQARTELRSQVNQLEQQIVGIKAERDEALGQVASAKAERDEALGQVVSINAERDEALGQVVSAKAERDEALGQVSALEQALQQSEQEKPKFEKQLQILRQELGKVNSSKNKALKKVDALQNQLQHEKERLSTDREALKKAKSAQNALQARVDELSTQEQAAQKSIGQLRQQLQERESKIEELQRTLADSDATLQFNLELLKSNKKQLEQESLVAVSRRSQVNQLKQQVASAKAERDEVLEQVSALRQALQQSKQEMGVLRSQKKQAKEELEWRLAALGRELDVISSSKNKALEKVQALRDELQHEKKRLSTDSEALKKAKRAQKALQAKVDELSAQEQAAQKSIGQLRPQLEERESKIEALQRTLAQLQRQLEKVEKEREERKGMESAWFLARQSVRELIHEEVTTLEAQDADANRAQSDKMTQWWEWVEQEVAIIENLLPALAAESTPAELPSTQKIPNAQKLLALRWVLLEYIRQAIQNAKQQADFPL